MSGLPTPRQVAANVLSVTLKATDSGLENSHVPDVTEDFDDNKLHSRISNGIEAFRAQDKIRYVDGRGRILPDVYAETRLLNLPPAVTALLIVFNRNHNYIADLLLRINERGTWEQDISKLAPTPQKLKQQDHEIFNTARLINSSAYANVVLGDYLAAILGTVRDGSSWTLNIAGERREVDHRLLERGTGNSCSVGLYRLHPSMSKEDAEYTERAFHHLFGPEVDFNTIIPKDFEYGRVKDRNGNKVQLLRLEDLSEPQAKDLIDDGKPLDYLLPEYDYRGFTDESGRPIANPRDPKTFKYPDILLAKALVNVTSVPAHAFQARGVPGVMRSRNWGCCSLNEFRRFLGLKPYATFEEWNSDKSVADAARKLYRNTENLELYVDTMSRAILADAVALIRGDRYFTYDYTPLNLTTWGFIDSTRNVHNASWGGVLTKLGQAKGYTFMPQSETILIADSNGIYNRIGDLNNSHGLITLYSQKIKDVELIPGYLSAIDNPLVFSRATKLVQDIFVPSAELDDHGKWFYDKTIELIGQKKYVVYEKGPTLVDIVKDVLRLVPVHWASYQIAGLPVKSKFEPRGFLCEQQLYQILREIHTYIFVEGSPTMQIPDRRQARNNVDRLRLFVKISLREAKGGISATVLGGLAHLLLGGTHQHHRVLQRLLDLSTPEDEAANDVISVISTASIKDKSADDNAEKKALYDKIIAIASKGSDSSTNATLEGYVREALRLDPVVEGVYRIVTKDIPVGYLTSKAGDRLYFDLARVGRDDQAFDSPEIIDPTRPASAYSTYRGDTVFKTLGDAFVTCVTAQVLRAVFTQRNVQRTKGVAGTLRRYREPVIRVDDTVQATPVEVDFKSVDEDGNIVDTPWKETVFKYTLTPGDPEEAADRWSYLDSDIGHRPSTWATGLTLSPRLR
ncbi:heme peroxidase [Cantharellus anzutake]|uniref:heme peroxidase n=1 Tax=Cantharellus anzutake TaxID=1750568 RepID=UPI001902D3A8|nr:heme peroxidase [Cantharellus anzutake]KAF8322372.1 heme peroxidase [Cantharellus anzutake]